MLTTNRFTLNDYCFLRTYDEPLSHYAQPIVIIRGAGEGQQTKHKKGTTSRGGNATERDVDRLGARCACDWPRRYSMLVEDGVVKQLNVEPDGTGLTCSLAEGILSRM
ncbi:unnamed protein product [Lampetra planeri]